MTIINWKIIENRKNYLSGEHRILLYWLIKIFYFLFRHFWGRISPQADTVSQNLIIFGSKDQWLWRLPQFKLLWTSIWLKKWKKWIFAGIRGEHGGTKMRDASWCIFCVHWANLFLTPCFFSILELILVLQFKSRIWERQLLQRNVTKLPWINLGDLIDLQVCWVTGGSEYTWLTAMTCYRHMTERNSTKIWPAIRFCP